MGILDELRGQAESIKNSSETERERQERLLHYYRDEINPKMLEIYRFLHELVTHLNFVKPDVRATYSLPAIGSFSDFKQGDYRLVADSDTEMKDIKFHFCCERPGEFHCFLENRSEVERVEEFLSKNHVQFYCKKERDDRYNVVSGDFRVKSTVPVLFRIMADIAESRIQVAITNFDSFGVRKLILTPSQIDEAFLDRFASYIIRRESEFLQTKLSEQDMQKIRERMLQEKAEQEETWREIQKAEEAELFEQSKNKKRLLNGFGFLKDKNSVKN